MIRFFDSHAHYDDQRFKNEFPGGTDGALDYSFENNVRAIVNSGSNLETSYNSILLSQKYANVFATVGIHPTDSQYIKKGELETSFLKIEEMAKTEKVVAIGEIGLDYHYDDTVKEVQKYSFEAQLDIAERLNLPVVIHTRDAMGDTLDILDKHKNVRGIFHSFNGSTEIISQYTKRGWYFSYSGPVTYKNATNVKNAARYTDEDRIMIETDAPYLPPVPKRGEINVSAFLRYTCEVIAELREKNLMETAEITFNNSCRAFGIDPSMFM